MQCFVPFERKEVETEEGLTQDFLKSIIDIKSARASNFLKVAVVHTLNFSASVWF